MDTYPWYPAESLKYGATVFNGSREEYDSYMGYPARPSIAHVGELHAVTIVYLSAILISWRERSMAEHVISLYDRLTREHMNPFKTLGEMTVEELTLCLNRIPTLIRFAKASKNRTLTRRFLRRKSLEIKVELARRKTSDLN